MSLIDDDEVACRILILYNAVDGMSNGEMG
jgi:hypothetical protein